MEYTKILVSKWVYKFTNHDETWEINKRKKKEPHKESSRVELPMVAYPFSLPKLRPKTNKSLSFPILQTASFFQPQKVQPFNPCLRWLLIAKTFGKLHVAASLGEACEQWARCRRLAPLRNRAGALYAHGQVACVGQRYPGDGTYAWRHWECVWCMGMDASYKWGAMRELWWGHASGLKWRPGCEMWGDWVSLRAG